MFVFIFVLYTNLLRHVVLAPESPGNTRILRLMMNRMMKVTTVLL